MLFNISENFDKEVYPYKLNLKNFLLLNGKNILSM